MNAIHCTFIKVSDNENDVRTKETKGIFLCPPKVGDCFILTAESIHPDGDARVIWTTAVQRIDKGVGECTIHTRNSSYRIVLDGFEVG